jgi:hypothetical protein
MEGRLISENVGAILIIIGTVIFATIIFSVLSGFARMENPGVTTSKFEVNLILGTGPSGLSDTPVIRVGYLEGLAIPVESAVIRLTDPYGTDHAVLPAIIRDGEIEAGGVWYIFCFAHGDPRTSGYWYTDDAGVIFTTRYRNLCGPEPFSPPGTWKLTIVDDRYGKKLVAAALTIK